MVHSRYFIDRPPSVYIALPRRGMCRRMCLQLRLEFYGALTLSTNLGMLCRRFIDTFL